MQEASGADLKYLNGSAHLPSSFDLFADRSSASLYRSSSPFRISPPVDRTFASGGIVSAVCVERHQQSGLFATIPCACESGQRIAVSRI